MVCIPFQLVTPANIDDFHEEELDWTRQTGAAAQPPLPLTSAASRAAMARRRRRLSDWPEGTAMADSD